MRERTPETQRVMEHKNRNKRVEAEKRQLHRDQLSSETQLSMLDQRLGKNVGAKKERKRLQ